MPTTIPGLVILADRQEDEPGWLLARTGVVTATAAAAIAGSHPYYKMIDVWNELTDPDHDRDVLRNRWLEERAQNGTQREPEIIAWAQADKRTGGDGAPFAQTGALVTRKELQAEHPILPPACSPDAYKIVARKLVLIEAKTSSQNWREDGIPQHILDQCIWQGYVTGAKTVWVAQERYEWSGKGDARVATLLDTWLEPIIVAEHERRLAWLLERVEEFRGYYRDGIAPESDVPLTEPQVIEFEDDEATVAEKLEANAAAAHLDAELVELAEIRERSAADLARAKAIEANVKSVADEYAGRRVHLVGSRMIAKLVRFAKTNTDTKALPPETLREITSWSMTQRLVIEPNPEYVPPAE